MVNLIYKDHLLAHYYLIGCAIGQGKYWNLYSIFLATGHKYVSQSDIDFIKQLPQYQEMYESAINSAPNHRKGTTVSKETIQKMSEAQKLRI